MKKILLKKCLILDPGSNTNEVGDILVSNGTIDKISANIPDRSNYKILDLEGQWAMPGLIDTQVTFGEPGREDVETIQEGALRAVKGGFVAVCTLPNTDLPINNQALVKFILSEGKVSPIYIYPTGVISQNENSGNLSEMYELKKVGCIGFSNGREAIIDSLTMRRALEYARMVGSIIYSFPDDPYLSNNGFASEGFVATELGFRATPVESEQIAISRDVLLAQLTMGDIHIGPITTRGSCELIQQAKKKKLNITAFTASHYLYLTDSILFEVLAKGKIFPPFRSNIDRKYLIKSCQNGTIDILVSDHNPHPPFEVEREIENAPFGISNLETALAAAVESLIFEGKLEPMIIPRLFSYNPAKRFGLPLGTLKEGVEANITCLDPNKATTVNEETFISRCINNPFLEKDLRGFPTTLISKGRIVLEKGRLI